MDNDSFGEGREDRKDKRLSKKISTKNSDEMDDHIGPSLTLSEGEIMLIIKFNPGISINGIVQKYPIYFNTTKSRSRISEILTAIKNKQRRFKQNYIERTLSRPSGYSIPDRLYVDERPTSILLLELRGYKYFERNDTILFDNFIEYIEKVYGNEITDIKDRLNKAVDAKLVIIDEQIGAGKKLKVLKEGQHYRFDLNYFVLLAQNSLADLKKKQQEIEGQLRLSKGIVELRKLKRDSTKNCKLIDHISELINVSEPNPK